jgi:hypothetical protein
MTDLSFTIAAGPRQRIHSRLRVPLNFFYITYKNPVRTSQETRPRYKGQPVNAVYCEDHMKYINTLCDRMHNSNMLKQVVNILTTGL